VMLPWNDASLGEIEADLAEWPAGPLLSRGITVAAGKMWPAPRWPAPGPWKSRGAKLALRGLGRRGSGPVPVERLWSATTQTPLGSLSWKASSAAATRREILLRHLPRASD